MKYILVFALTCLSLLAGLAGFIYKVDPLCYYHCDEIELNRPTQNVYYNGAKIAKAHPEAEILILGSSRGQTTSPLWLENVTGKKTLNLSLGGADLLLKMILAKISAQSGAKIKKIIWLADYFELIKEDTDAKVFNTDAFKAYLPDKFQMTNSANKLSYLQRLIDHNSLEAAIASVKMKQFDHGDQGAGTSIEYQKCLADGFRGSTKTEVLPKEVDLLFENYKSNIFKAQQSEEYWALFMQQLEAWNEQGIEVEIVVAPYHPRFIERMKSQIPHVYQSHLNWLNRIQGINLGKIHFSNYFAGIPGGDDTPVYWNDGVHFTCKGAMRMLEGVISPLSVK